MPVDLAAVDAVARSVAGVYGEAELAISRMIARRLAAGLGQSDWATRRLAELGAMRRAAGAVVAQLYRDGDEAVRRGVAIAYRAGNDAAVADLADSTAPHLAAAARAAARRSVGGRVQALADAVVSELRPVHEAILPQALDTYRRAVAGATARALAGGQPRRYAAQAAWSALVDRGITGYTTTDGRRLRLSTYVEMATRTAVTRAMAQGVIDEATAAGNRYVYVDSHPRRCPLCAPWEHKVLTLWGPGGDHEHVAPHGRRATTVVVPVAGTLAEARAAGLMHPNCSHQIRPYLPGITVLAAVQHDDAGYVARQQQRGIERQLRHWREQHTLALTDEGRAHAQRHVRRWDAAMHWHTQHHDLKRIRHRELPGAGHEAAPGRRGDRADLASAGRRRGRTA